MSEFTDAQAHACLEQIKGWLNAGATIKAVDPDVEVLVPDPDGPIRGGMLVTWPSDASTQRSHIDLIGGPNV